MHMHCPCRLCGIELVRFWMWCFGTRYGNIHAYYWHAKFDVAITFRMLATDITDANRSNAFAVSHVMMLLWLKWSACYRLKLRYTGQQYSVGSLTVHCTGTAIKYCAWCIEDTRYLLLQPLSLATFASLCGVHYKVTDLLMPHFGLLLKISWSWHGRFYECVHTMMWSVTVVETVQMPVAYGWWKAPHTVSWPVDRLIKPLWS